MPTRSLIFLLSTVLLICACKDHPQSTTKSKPPVPGANGAVRLAFIENADYKDTRISIGNLPVGAKVQLQAIGIDDGDERHDITQIVNWTSRHGDVASVSPTGLLTAIKSGQTQLIARFGDDSQQLGVLVKEKLLTLFGDAERFVKGDTVAFYVKLADVDGGDVDYPANNAVSWEISDNDVATVDTSGVVSLQAVGDTVLTAKVSGLIGTFDLHVTDRLVLNAAGTTPDSVALRWNTIADADYYRLVWQGENWFLAPPEVISGTIENISTTSFVHTGRLPDDFYRYRVDALKRVESGERIVLSSDELPVLMPANNAAVLRGDLIGSAAHTNDYLVKKIDLSVVEPRQGLELAATYLNRSGLVMQAVTEVANNLDRPFCNVALKDLTLLDVDGKPLQTLRTVSSLLRGSMRQVSPYNDDCIGPHRRGYVNTLLLGAEAEFDRIAGISAARYEQFTVGTVAIPQTAVIPQSYIVVPPVVGGALSKLRVTIKNMGTQAAQVSEYSGYILLDDQGVLLREGSLAPVEGWTGLLDVGKTNTLIGDIYYTGTATRAHVIVRFDPVQ